MLVYGILNTAAINILHDDIMKYIETLHNKIAEAEEKIYINYPDFDIIHEIYHKNYGEAIRLINIKTDVQVS